MRARGLLVLIALLLAAPATRAAAQDPLRLTFHFQPTKRAQLAIWIESEDGRRFQTILLTDSVGRYGIGNRPGALEMNSGFLWPYGRREGALPVWAHRRVEVGGGAPFRRVIFRNREEGAASQDPIRAGDPYRDNDDPYFCLSFALRDMPSSHTVDALDAMACPSRYMSDRGRYITGADVDAGYSEPYVRGDGRAVSLPLSMTSLYPPRRDIEHCTDSCPNDPDTQRYAADARAAMPEIDVVSQPTLTDATPARIRFAVPNDWPVGHSVAYIEVNTEGDYNDTYDDLTYPTPTAPVGLWDYWALTTGYPYRGQPSVVYRLDFDFPTVDPLMDVTSTSLAVGHGSVDGRGGADATMYDMSDGTMTLDRPGSGAQRLLPIASDGSRVRLEVRSPSYCVGTVAPGAVGMLVTTHSADEHHSHEWAHLSFTVPDHDRDIAGYEVRVGTSPITDAASFSGPLSTTTGAYAATLDNVALDVPTDGVTGSTVEVDFGHLDPSTHYWVGVRSATDCATGPITVSELDTTAIHFTTVSPCFVATAAYGSPLAGEIGALRRFRDRHMETNTVGRAVVRAYYGVGPTAAGALRTHPAWRRAVQALLRPIVAAARAFDD